MVSESDDARKSDTQSVVSVLSEVNHCKGLFESESEHGSGDEAPAPATSAHFLLSTDESEHGSEHGFDDEAPASTTSDGYVLATSADNNRNCCDNDDAN